MPSLAAVADDDRTIGRAAPAASSTASTAAFVGVCALVLVVPYEGVEPLLAIPGQNVTSAEVVLVAAGLLWLTAVARSCVRPAWRTPLTFPWLALCAAMIASAALAPAHQGNAFNMAGRCGLALGVYLLTVNALASPSRLRQLLLITSLSGACVALLVVTEYLGVAGVARFLEALRGRAALVGADLRAGGPFQYATIASMFLEIVFALSLAWLPAAIDADRPWRLAAAMLLLVLLAEAVVLTFTRAGLVTMLASLLLVGGVHLKRHGVDRVVLALGVLALLIPVLLAASRPMQSLSLRMTTEGMDAWFRAAITGPAHLHLSTGETATVPLVVSNTGRATWDPLAPSPFRFSYHWLRAAEDVVVNWEGARTDFPAPVRPGQQITLHATVIAPSEPGEYRLMWDVEHEQRLWFSTEPGATLAVAKATVSGAAIPSTPPASGGRPLPTSASRPGRLALWDAARQMLADRPLFGIGPDNFRLSYGAYLGRSHFDTRVHSNSMYLEVLAGGGLVAGLALAWFLWRAARSVFTAAGRRGDDEAAALAVAAAILAIAVHGLVDTFWGFTPTYVLMAVTLGLLTSAALPPDSDAHRI